MRARSTPFLLLPLLALGCLSIGIASVTKPERLPQEGLPALDQRLLFDVCVLPDTAAYQARPAQRDYLRTSVANRITKALARAGVRVQLVSPAGAPVHFTFSDTEVDDYEWSMVLSAVTFSIIPGYFAERHVMDVSLARADPARLGRPERLQYRSKKAGYIWAPFLVYPDFIESPVAAWGSEKYTDGGFEGTMARLADDLRDRFGRGGAPAALDSKSGVTCPVPDDEP